MPLLVVYILKFSIGLAVAWLFYQLALRRVTFYSWNRWYLMGYTMLCFFIPLIDVHRVVEKVPFTAPAIIRFVPGFRTPVRDPSWDLIISILAAVSAILLIRLVIGWVSVRNIRRRATLIDRGWMEIYQVDEPIVPFSFGNAIYINARLHTEKEYEEIILHEYVHIRQRHTVDILFAELLCVFAWYNPFAWLIRHSIRQNLEFIADGKVLEKGFDRKGYQYHLLKVIGEPRYRLVNNFNFSSLKKRIVMMNKIRSTRLQLVKFLFILPLLAVLLVAFRNQINNRANRPIAIDVPVDRKAEPAKLLNTVGAKEEMKIGMKEETKIKGRKDAGTGIRDSVPREVKSDEPGPDPVYFVDGVEMMRASVMAIPPDRIYSINVLKGESAAPFGPKGKNGIILITMKQAPVGTNKTSSSGPDHINVSMDSSRWVIKSDKPESTMTMQGGKYEGAGRDP